MKSFITFIICILMLFAFTGYSHEYSQEYNYSRELKKMTLEEQLARIRETQKWAEKYGITSRYAPLTEKVVPPVEPDEAHYPNVFVWVLLGLGAGLVLGTLSNQPKNP